MRSSASKLGETGEDKLQIILKVLAIAVGSLGCGTMGAWAEDLPDSSTSKASAIEEVVVTATKTGATEEQRTPMAISVFSGAQLEVSGVDNVRDLVAFTPNLNVAQTSANAQIYIRGIGSNNVFNGSDPDVTVQSDGVYIARAYGQFVDFVDIDRIEVLRGPQGTLYGRNAVGGTINIISRMPSDQVEAKAQISTGNYSLIQAQDYVSGPLLPGVLQGSISVNYINHSPYVEDIAPGQKGLDNANRGGFRAQLRFVPSDKVEAVTRFDWNRADERFDSTSHLEVPVPYAPLASSLIGNDRVVAINDPQNLATTNWGVSEDINVALSDALSLKSLTAYRGGAYTVFNDSDATEVTVNTAYQTDQSKQISQELDLNLKFDSLEAVIGAYYFHEHETSTIQNSSPPSVATPAAGAVQTSVFPDSRVRSAAVFAQGTYHLTNTLGFTAGVRYTSDRKELDQDFLRTSLAPTKFEAVLPGFPLLINTDRDFKAWTPKFGADWQAGKDVMLYASITRGFKSGGTNFAGTNALTLSFNPEYIWSYEAGIKSEWLDNRLRLNLTGFYYDYTNLQVQSLIAPGVASIGNAASAHAKGLELETIAKPNENLTFTFNYSLLDSEYSSFDNSSVPAALRPFVANSPRYNAAAGTFDATGYRLSGAPHTSISASAQYDIPITRGNFYVRAEYYWQSRVYYQPTNILIASQASYDLTNVSLGYLDNDKWSIRLIAKNLSDTEYLINVASNIGGPAGPPRTVVLQLTKQW
jgi:iron complex outermembrane receptor protein